MGQFYTNWVVVNLDDHVICNNQKFCLPMINTICLYTHFVSKVLTQKFNHCLALLNQTIIVPWIGATSIHAICFLYILLHCCLVSVNREADYSLEYQSYIPISDSDCRFLYSSGGGETMFQGYTCVEYTTHTRNSKMKLHFPFVLHSYSLNRKTHTKACLTENNNYLTHRQTKEKKSIEI